MSPTSSPPLKALRIQDFSAGPNIRDAASKLALNEVVDSWNMTFDERGSVASRTGMDKYNSTAFSGGVTKNGHYSGILDNTITQAGASLYLGTTNTARKTFTTAARAVFADFNGKVYAGHPVDGLFYSTDGITWTAVVDADRPTTCVAIAVWENQLYVIPAGSNRFVWSDIGDGTAWTAASFNDVRAKDDEPLVGFASSAGIDVAGRGGLLVYKRESMYRIIDSSTGEYIVIDPTVGGASALSVTQVGNLTIALSEHGIFETDGVGPMRNVSDRFQPLFDAAQINFAQLDLFCAGRKGDRAYFSLCRAGASANDLSIEYHPGQGWFAPGSNAASFYMTYGLDTERLYGGHPSTSGRVYHLYSGGDDDGTAISWRVQTRWVEPNDGYLCQLWRVRVFGRASASGDVEVVVRKDYALAGGTSYDIDLSGSTPLYDTGALYDDGELYGPAASQESADLYSLGTCKSFSLVISGSTSTTGTSPQVLGTGTAPEVGAVAVYSIDLLHVPLGVA